MLVPLPVSSFTSQQVIQLSLLFDRIFNLLSLLGWRLGIFGNCSGNRCVSYFRTSHNHSVRANKAGIGAVVIPVQVLVFLLLLSFLQFLFDPKDSIGLQSLGLLSLLSLLLLSDLGVLLAHDFSSFEARLYCKEGQEKSEAHLEDEVGHGRIHDDTDEATHHDSREHDDGEAVVYRHRFLFRVLLLEVVDESGNRTDED